MQQSLNIMRRYLDFSSALLAADIRASCFVTFLHRKAVKDVPFTFREAR
jgi:hypothetical protein